MRSAKGVYLGGDLQFLQEAVAQTDGPILRLCFGYAGWQAGQLEREFLDGGWYLCPAQARHIFEVPPEKLWQELLRELGGKYATLSMIPKISHLINKSIRFKIFCNEMPFLPKPVLKKVPLFFDPFFSIEYIKFQRIKSFFHLFPF